MRLCLWTAILLGTIGVSLATPPQPQHSTQMTRNLTVSTRDSLILTQGAYSSILFTAKSSTRARVPVQYSFVESGAAPPGMIFENYPCNKPGHAACPQLASSDGIFLDGIPSSPGSYDVTIAATGPDGSKGSQSFTIIIKARRKTP